MKKLFALSLGLLLAGAAFAPAAYSYEGFNGPLGVLTDNEDIALKGYTLVSPQQAKKTYMIDMKGNVVMEWDSEYTGWTYVMLDPHNGNLLRHVIAPEGVDTTAPFGGQAGIIEEFDWTGKKIWEFKNYIPEKEISHHTFNVMPNGNIILLMWKHHTYEEALAKGLNPDQFGRYILPNGIKSVSGKTLLGIWVDSVREIERGTGKTVWEWDVWDHIGTGPDQFDINAFCHMKGNKNMSGPDWTHCNGVSYNPRTNEVCFTSRNLAEVYVIDYGKNEGIKMRWGNPANYGQGKAPAGYMDDGDQKLFGPHAPDWTADDTITIFDNGTNRPSGNYSRYVEISRDGKLVRDWKAGDSGTSNFNFYTPFQGGTQKLSNGNFIITCTDGGHIVEVTPDNKIAWEFINPMGRENKVYSSTSDSGFTRQFAVHKAWRYAADSQELKGKDLSVKHPLMPEGTPDWLTLLKAGVDGPNPPAKK